MAEALRVSLDLKSSTPAYRQIAHDLRRHLVDERLKPGDLLPPIRQLALDLGVHFTTVALAYRRLADEGWLELKRRRGATDIVGAASPRGRSTVMTSDAWSTMLVVTVNAILFHAMPRVSRPDILFAV